MIKVIISGYGKMGHMVEKELERRGIELVEASEDITAVNPALAAQCVCIDFTTPEAFCTNYSFIAKNFKAAVVGTTGWDGIKDLVFKAFDDAGTPLIYASNFSLGVNALYAAVSRVADMLRGAGYTRPWKKSTTSTSWTPPPARPNPWPRSSKTALASSPALPPSGRAKYLVSIRLRWNRPATKSPFGTKLTPAKASPAAPSPPPSSPKA